MNTHVKHSPLGLCCDFRHRSEALPVSIARTIFTNSVGLQEHHSAMPLRPQTPQIQSRAAPQQWHISVKTEATQ